MSVASDIAALTFGQQQRRTGPPADAPSWAELLFAWEIPSWWRHPIRYARFVARHTRIIELEVKNGYITGRRQREHAPYWLRSKMWMHP